MRGETPTEPGQGPTWSLRQEEEDQGQEEEEEAQAEAGQGPQHRAEASEGAGHQASQRREVPRRVPGDTRTGDKPLAIS